MLKKTFPNWLLYALLTTLCWGVWGAFIEKPEQAGFPATLIFVMWALALVPFALFALAKIGWRPETSRRAMWLGALIGLTGGGGQLLLYQALRDGPAYLIFPIISLYPVLTIGLSLLFLGERADRRQTIGILVALAAIFFLTYQPGDGGPAKGYLWLVLSGLVFLLWGVQSFFMKYANERIRAESIFFYTTLAGLALIPLALLLTDFSQPINWSFQGPWLAFLLHLLNAAGLLLLIYAMRYGKAIIVAPLIGMAPVITVILSLFLYGVVPGLMLTIGLVLATGAILLLAK